MDSESFDGGEDLYIPLDPQWPWAVGDVLWAYAYLNAFDPNTYSPKGNVLLRKYTVTQDDIQVGTPVVVTFAAEDLVGYAADRSGKLGTFEADYQAQKQGAGAQTTWSQIRGEVALDTGSLAIASPKKMSR